MSATVTRLPQRLARYQAIEVDGRWYVVWREYDRRDPEWFTQTVLGRYDSQFFAERNARLLNRQAGVL